MLLRRSLPILFVAAVLVISAINAESCWAKKNGTARPIKGRAEGVLVDVVPPNQLVIDYVGRASHLGNFTRREFLFLNGDGTFQGTIIFIAANGDELYATFAGEFTSPNEAEGTYIFDGGTGRFEDASGQADFEATADLPNASVTFVGDISY